VLWLQVVCVNLGILLMDFVIILSGKLRYANNSNYKNDTMIRKEVSNHNEIILHKIQVSIPSAMVS
jgi:hypothetical protein